MKRKYRYGYKVVRDRSYSEMFHDGKLLGSAFANGTIRYYEIGKTTEPRLGDGPLTVFNTYEDALTFWVVQNEVAYLLDIYRCKYVPYKGTRYLWAMLDRFRVGKLRRVGNVMNLPKGTRLADEVVLSYQVDERCKRI